MSETRQVKVDNWGIYFLQRLKHFFNRTDYCDLTLQFQDNAQLKVHRLVLSACTEYFELLERTCEMYEDCLVMPDDLQADVVVPIINFMYTGQLEFKLDLLEKLYQTSLIMNMPVLTKLLDAHRGQQQPAPAKPAFSSSNNLYGKRYSKVTKTIPMANATNKRSYTSAFDGAASTPDAQKVKKPTEMFSKAECLVKNGKSPSYHFPVFSEKNKRMAKDPRPTRYELPEELDEENIFDNSFTNISYTSKPLMVHPETTKQYEPKRLNLFEEGTSSSRFMRGSTNDIVECRKISVNDGIFLDSLSDNTQDDCSFTSTQVKEESKDISQLFDQILENNTSKITIETKNNTQVQNIDHAKIISEVLKKYPHLVKSNKNIKLKILNTAKTKKMQSNSSPSDEKGKPKSETPDFTYETDVINSKEAARLIALGAENISGPWICLICGTPGKALHFTSYYNFRKHLVEVHNEKPVPSICEYCGVKSQKRNYIVHHKLTKHGIPAPAAYNFPKCNHCTYVALNEALLIKHKSSHSEKSYWFNLPSFQIAGNVSKSGQKYNQAVTLEKKNNLQCIYCLRVFLREHNLYAHLKINHKEAAKIDGIIDDSEEEQEAEKFASNSKLNIDPSNMIKVEVPVTYKNSYEDKNEQYQIEEKPDGIYVLTKKINTNLPANKNKILNLGFSSTQQQNMPSIVQSQKSEPVQNTPIKRNDFMQNTFISQMRSLSNEDTVIIDNNEYVLQDNQLIPKKDKMLADCMLTPITNNAEIQSTLPTTSVEYRNIHTVNPEHKLIIKKSTHINQPLQIVVSNEEEYKALMNSNQSIIYHEGEPNKGLPELGVADHSTLETGTIDLDNTQPNDMMIIQDFPINVSETVSANNPNIVVVYSHPVENQNKQYSLITQGLEGEFVQSSGIITENYETVTTCNPMIPTHTSLENTWQNNANKLTLTPSMELQTMTVGESITITPHENVPCGLNELPEVQLTESQPVTLEITQAENAINTLPETNLMSTINESSDNLLVREQNTIISLTESNVLQEMQPETTILPTSSTDTDQSAIISSFVETSCVSTLEETKITTAIDEVVTESHTLQTTSTPAEVDEEIMQQNEPTEVGVPAIPETTSCETMLVNSNSSEDTQTHSTSVSNNIDENKHEIPEINNIETEPDKDKNPESMKESEIENTQVDVNEIDINEENTNDVTLPNIAKEQIENLASEWSEEESDIPPEKSDVSSTSLEVRNEDTAESTESEETIENIQKEVQKQIPNQLNSEIEFCASQSMSCTDDSQTDTNDNESVKIDSQEKISSLLNDWDDNDSQEDAPTINNQSDVNIMPANTDTQNEVKVPVNNNGPVEKTETKKHDNIKSLVSDWDEDDEDENKV